jgi:hypothetical protein
MKLSKKKYVLAGAVLISTVIFSSWGFIQWISGLQHHYGAVATSSYEFQSIYSWLPIIRSIVHGNLFPVMPTLDSNADGILFYPYLGLWIYSFMINVFGIKATIIIGQVLFPTLSYFLLLKIFKRYLNSLWSISLSLACLFTFYGWPFRAFLIAIIQSAEFLHIGVIQPLAISTLPIPSLSILYFLLLFYISTNPIKLTTLRISSLTFFWAILSQFHPVDALFGITFWIVYFSIRLYRQQRANFNYYFITIVQLLIILIVFTPLFYGYKNAISSEFSLMSEIGLLAKQSSIGIYYYLIYFAIPLFAISIIYFVKRIDIFEIVIKFWHIYVLLLVELLLISMNFIFNIGIDISSIQDRIALFFLHFYYYVPVIYYAGLKSGFDYSFGIESKPTSRVVSKSFRFIFSKLNIIYLPVIILLLILYSGISAYKSYIYQKEVESPALAQVWGEFEELKRHIPNDAIVVSHIPAINLIATIDLSSQYGSLWVNRFSNDISRDEAIDRLILYAHLYNWSSEKFISFMLPGELQKKQGGFVDLTLNQVQISGVGYWLVYHKSIFDSVQTDYYKSMLLQKYTKFSLTNAIKRFNIKFIQTNIAIPKSISAKLIYEEKFFLIYQIIN